MTRGLSRFATVHKRTGGILAILLGGHLLVCAYSSAVGVFEAVCFVRKQPNPLQPLSGIALQTATLFPASQQFGYFAPQVCSEFRAKVHLGSSKTQKVGEVQFDLPPESAQLLSSFDSATQDEGPARVIAASYASYSLNKYRNYDYAFVIIEGERLPPLRLATRLQPQWIPMRGYYFKR